MKRRRSKCRTKNARAPPCCGPRARRSKPTRTGPSCRSRRLRLLVLVGRVDQCAAPGIFVEAEARRRPRGGHAAVVENKAFVASLAGMPAWPSWRPLGAWPGAWRGVLDPELAEIFGTGTGTPEEHYLNTTPTPASTPAPTPAPTPNPSSNLNSYPNQARRCRRSGARRARACRCRWTCASPAIRSRAGTSAGPSRSRRAAPPSGCSSRVRPP